MSSQYLRKSRDHGTIEAHRDSWLSQGYKIKALHLETSQVTFRREDKNTSGVVLPKALTNQRLPEEVVYKFNKMVQQFAKDYGLI